MQRLEALFSKHLLTCKQGLDGDADRTFGFEHEEADQLSAWIRDGFDRQQQLLWANRKHSILIWLQGPDCSGKDGAIRNLLRGLNPQGVVVSDFPKPTPAELSEDFLTRYLKHLPKPGYISVFNRTPYEGVVSDLADGIISKSESKKRLAQLLNLENKLKQQNVQLLKVYLHISKPEQKQRLAQRVINPEKHWKISTADLAGHRQFEQIKQHWQQCITHSSTAQHPWYVMPSNHKWLRNLLLAQLLNNTFQSLDLTWPKPALPFGLEELEKV